MKFFWIWMVLAALSAPVWAETLPCQTESVEMDFNARRLYGDGHSKEQYREFEAKTDEWEAKYVACMDQYEKQHGSVAREELAEQLVYVTRQINEARNGE